MRAQRISTDTDVRIIDTGSLVLFLLLSDEARRWVQEHAGDDAQFLGVGLAAEPGYAAALAAGMTSDGLVVEPDRYRPHETSTNRDEDTGTAEIDPVVAVLTTSRHLSTSDRYDLGWLFTCWVWESGFADWDRGVRVLARTLRGLERTGLIERRTIRRSGQPTNHGFVLTVEGRKAVEVLSGHWIEEDQR